MENELHYENIYIVLTSIYYEGSLKPEKHREFFHDYDNALKAYNGMIEHRYFNPFVSPKVKEKIIKIELYGMNKDGKYLHDVEKSKEFVNL